jgi:hypothetical protein
LNAATICRQGRACHSAESGLLIEKADQVFLFAQVSRGSGQRPEALRDFAIFAIDFHHFLSCFQLGKMSMIGTFCTHLFQSETRIN